MKTKKVRLASMVLLTLTLIVVGVMVWPTPKKALANVTYTITAKIWDEETEDWTALWWGTVRLHLNGLDYDLECDAQGRVQQEIANWDLNGWEAEVIDPQMVQHQPPNNHDPLDGIAPPISFQGSQNSGVLWLISIQGQELTEVGSANLFNQLRVE